MELKAVEILEQNRVMGLATLRADGWPQTTLVGYANEGILIYFIVSRTGQKFANINRDNRVSLAIGRDFHDPKAITGLSIAARADEVRDPAQRKRAIEMLLARHPGLRRLEAPEPEHSAVMRANPELISVLDYSQGFGHADLLTVGAGGLVEMTAARDDDWGYGETVKPVS